RIAARQSTPSSTAHRRLAARSSRCPRRISASCTTAASRTWTAISGKRRTWTWPPPSKPTPIRLAPEPARKEPRDGYDRFARLCPARFHFVDRLGPDRAVRPVHGRCLDRPEAAGAGSRFPDPGRAGLAAAARPADRADGTDV